MCTVTLFYDQNNALARRKLAALLATGLFSQQTIDDNEPTPEAIEAHRQERCFLGTFQEEYVAHHSSLPMKYHQRDIVTSGSG